MTWLDQLGESLAARGVSGRDRRRILAELSDHIACEPASEARLGDPVQLAETFADELATGRARRGAWQVFGALAMTAVALVISMLTLARVGYPGFNHGLSQALFWPALIGMFVAPQAALVAGTLAAVRCLRRRRSPQLAAAEVSLIRRRAWVGLGAGLATVAGLELYVIDFSARLPAWWLTLTATLAAIAGLALLTVARELRSSATIVSSAAGPAGDVFDDLPLIGPVWLRRDPWRLGALACAIAGLAFTLFEAHAEHSWLEGLQRGIFEGLAAAAGFLLLGRMIGVRGGLPAVHWAPADLVSADVGPALTPPDQLAADEDRSQAEGQLRESFAAGRLDLDELTARLEAVHRARTLGDLRAALAGLPPLA